MRSKNYILKIMTLFNYILDNNVFLYVGFSATVGMISYKFVSSYLNSFYVDKGVQTPAWEDYSDRISQIGAESITSIETITPISENVSPTIQTTSEIGTQTSTDSISTLTTVLPIPPINIEMIPNPDLAAKVLDTITVGQFYVDRASALADMAWGGIF